MKALSVSQGHLNEDFLQHQCKRENTLYLCVNPYKIETDLEAEEGNESAFTPLPGISDQN